MHAAAAVHCLPSRPHALHARRSTKSRAIASPAHSFSMPALRMISPHFCDSAVWNLASSSGEVTNTTVPLAA
jgi:hypothetical protein